MIPIKWLFTSTMIIFYACGVMYLLLDVKWEKLSKSRKQAGFIFFLGFLILNIVAQMSLGYELYGKFYLILTQLPVYILFRVISEHKGIKLVFVLLTAVFFSSTVMFIISVIRYFVVPPVWIYALCCIGFILLIFRFFKKPFNEMLRFGDQRIFILFTAIPLLFYIYNFSLTQYQFADVVINKQYFIFKIPLLIVLVAYLLLVQIFKIISDKAELTNAQNLASAQLDAATKQIEQLRIAEKNFAIYRHDIRPHLSYLNACITENKAKEAADYINQTFDAMDRMKLEQYSINEPINLIISSYVGRAREKDISIEVSVTATDFERFQITDLCSLLANALENAIKACESIDIPKERYIKVRVYEKNHRLCIQMINSYGVEPVFDQKIPVSHHDGHGIGVKSMIHVMEKYDATYGFTAKNGVFTFGVSM